MIQMNILWCKPITYYMLQCPSTGRSAWVNCLSFCRFIHSPLLPSILCIPTLSPLDHTLHHFLLQAHIQTRNNHHHLNSLQERPSFSLHKHFLLKDIVVCLHTCLKHTLPILLCFNYLPSIQFNSILDIYHFLYKTHKLLSSLL